ncbi:hypothetical protein F8S13_12720 [Chloroflexia bacterium SDU3-3]|nr:hypothetical protein F8S13_12720 [Chloroflexia bacterium SDU3-3]
MHATPTIETPALGRWARYRAIWPIPLLLAAEALVLYTAPPARESAASPLSLVVAAVLLLTGLAPAALRPSRQTALFGCFAIIQAALIWRIQPDPAILGKPFEAAIKKTLSLWVLLRMVNTVFLAPLALHLVASLPARRIVPAWAIAGGYAGTALLLLLATLTPPGAATLGGVLLLLALFFGLQVAVLRLLLHYSRSGDTRAAQLARILFTCILLAEIPFALRTVGLMHGVVMPYEVVLLAQLILPAGICYAVLQHDLFQIDTVLYRAFISGAISITLLTLYFGLTVIATTLLRRVVPATPWLGALLGLLAAAALFRPLFRGTKAMADRIFYPERLQFQRVLAQAHEALSQAVRRDTVEALLAHDLPEQIGAAGARLTMGGEPPPALGRAWCGALVVGGRTLGHYWLGPRARNLPYTAAEQADLRTLLRQAALALAYAETFDELEGVNRELEERVATRTAHMLAQQRELAALAERQRIARDLHDSVKQTLFSMGLGLRATRRLLDADPPAASAALRTQEQLVVQAQGEMGQLLSHLRAPASGLADLVPALAALCAEPRQGLAVALHAPPALLLPAAQAAELAMIAREALHNALKHSGAAQASVALCAEDHASILQICDSGRGFDPARAVGHGIQGMRERAAACGASVEIQSAPGEGTTVTVLAVRPT